MRDALMVALLATAAGVILDRWMKKREQDAETAPAARRMPFSDIAAVGSPDQVMGSDYWSAFGQVRIVGESAPSSQVGAVAFGAYDVLGRRVTMQ